MSHCSPDELMDVIDGLRPAASLPHLTTCDACRAQIDELRELMIEVSGVRVPEPSPLFWDHLAARVRRAVADVAPPTRSTWSRVGEWRTWRPMWPAVAMAAAIVLVMFVALRTRPVPSDGAGATPAPRTAAVPPPVTAAAAGSPSIERPETGAAAEPLLAFMEDLAVGVDFDAAVSAGLMVESGTADAEVTRLSADEQVELQRLLREALARPDA